MREFRACFLRSLRVPLASRDVQERGAARAAASAAAASAFSDNEAVTLEDAIERMAWCRAVVKDSSSAVTGPLRRRARAAAASLRRAVAALARTRWVAVSQAQGFLDDQARGPGPQDRVGRAVPGAGDGGLVLAECGLGRAPPGQGRLPYSFRGRGLVIEDGGDQGACLRDFLPVAAGQDCVVLGGADRQLVFFPPGGAFSQVIRDPSGSQPPPGSDGRLIPSFTRATTWPPARRIAVIRS